MMGKNVFVSYSYHDSDVGQFEPKKGWTIGRDYVDVIEYDMSKSNKYNYRGEEDGEDNSDLHFKTIENILADKMFQTSITLVLISRGMMKGVEEIEQWMPWEISYSLYNKTRKYGNSNMNAILAVVLPDRQGSYSYALYDKGQNTFIKEKAFFKILLANMFNRMGTMYYADEHNNPLYKHGESYVVVTRWNDYCIKPDYYLGLALRNRSNFNQFMITKKLNKNWIS